MPQKNFLVVDSVFQISQRQTNRLLRQLIKEATNLVSFNPDEAKWLAFKPTGVFCLEQFEGLAHGPHMLNPNLIGKVEPDHPVTRYKVGQLLWNEMIENHISNGRLPLSRCEVSLIDLQSVIYGKNRLVPYTWHQLYLDFMEEAGEMKTDGTDLRMLFPKFVDELLSVLQYAVDREEAPLLIPTHSIELLPELSPGWNAFEQAYKEQQKKENLKQVAS
jgi:hypothetical protein